MIYTTTLAKPGDDCITLDSSRLHVIKLKDSMIEGIKNTSAYKIEHTFEVEDLNSANEKTYLKSVCKEIDFNSLLLIDMQKFTDEVYLAIQDKLLPDATEYMKELKAKSILEFGDFLLKNTGEMTLNTEYKSFGYIYSGLDKIGTFEKIKFIENNKINLLDVFSILSLNNTQEIGIEYYLLDKKYILKGIEYSDDNLFYFEDIIITENDLENKITPKENFEEYEDFIENRKSLLDININNDSLSIDEFDDLF